MRIQLPEKVSKIINCLTEAGYEAYAVGGCVRDTLLGRTPGDWDITTSAKPAEVKALFGRTIDTGILHGTVTVMLRTKRDMRITTYRMERRGNPKDARHPQDGDFIPRTCVEDLKRRDFTINAMAYNDAEGLIDVFDGIADLKKGVIRCVGRSDGPLRRGCIKDATRGALCRTAWIFNRRKDKRGDHLACAESFADQRGTHTDRARQTSGFRASRGDAHGI